MIIIFEIFGLNELVFRMLPIKLDGFGAFFQLPRKRVDGPLGLEIFIREAERLASS